MPEGEHSPEVAQGQTEEPKAPTIHSVRLVERRQKVLDNLLARAM